MSLAGGRAEKRWTDGVGSLWEAVCLVSGGGSVDKKQSKDGCKYHIAKGAVLGKSQKREEKKLKP